MNNNETLEEFFVWEEKNSTDLNRNLLKNAEQDKCVITTETKTNVENLHWKDITDPKLRRKMRKKEWYETNKDKIRIRENAAKKIYREKNKDKIKKSKKLYNEKNRDKRRMYFKLRRKNNIQYRLNRNLRGRLYNALKKNQKIGSFIKDLGCSVDELKIHLESKFQPGMSWNNYGMYGWHIDHIKPLDSFDLTKREQFLEACHYTNLQPLWAQDNWSKRNKIV